MKRGKRFLVGLFLIFLSAFAFCVDSELSGSLDNSSTDEFPLRRDPYPLTEKTEVESSGSENVGSTTNTSSSTNTSGAKNTNVSTNTNASTNTSGNSAAEPKNVVGGEKASGSEGLSTSSFGEDDFDNLLNSSDESETISESEADNDNEADDESEEYDFETVVIPEKKKPIAADSEKLEDARKRDQDGEEEKSIRETILYGTGSEIASSVDKIIENDDPRFLNELYDLFYRTNTQSIKVKLLEYFTKRKDPCLEDYAVEVLDDPYDYSNAIVEKCFNYVSEVQCKNANPALMKLIDQDDEKYFTGALTAIGKTGGKKEAKYLSQYLKRDDLEVPQRQALMRTLGQMNAEETWEDLVEICQDEEENSFVRMYAAEAIGNMKKEESIPVLIDLYEKSDPNMRQYCIKGLKNFPEDKKAKNAIIQGIRDDHYKVRLESIKAVKELKYEEAAEYLIYRSKNDSENTVKKECYPALAELSGNTAKEFLVSQITEKKVPDATKKMVCESVLAKGLYGEDEIIELAKETLKDDKRKDLRYALGKLFIKYARPGYAELCVLYLQSKDTTTISQGLELYKNAKYEMARPSVKAIAEDTKSKTALRDKAKKLLGIQDEEEEDKDKSSSSTLDAK